MQDEEYTKEPRRASSRAAMPALYEEHLALGARFEDGLVSGYANDDEIEQAGAVLADMSHVKLSLLSGNCAQDYAEATFAGKKLAVGECAFEAVLTGDGSVTSIPMLARTGNREYLCADASPRAEILDAWLSFIKSASSEGYSPYASLGLEEVTGSHVVLGLCGTKAKDVLLDYTSAASLPRPGHVGSCNLDRIPCVVVCLPTKGAPCFVVFVPPQVGATLWRSLLSFTFVCPASPKAFLARICKDIELLDILGSTDTIQISKSNLLGNGLVRSQDDYVGSHGLAQRGEVPKP